MERQALLAAPGKCSSARPLELLANGIRNSLPVKQAAAAGHTKSRPDRVYAGVPPHLGEAASALGSGSGRATVLRTSFVADRCLSAGLRPPEQAGLSGLLVAGLFLREFVPDNAVNCMAARYGRRRHWWT
jgi:hypothetical protein